MQGSAAGRKRQLILSNLLTLSTKAFFQKIAFKENMNGLDLGCGTGRTTLLLKALMGKSGKMTGIDMDAVNINLAKEIAGQHPKLSDVAFRRENILEWNDNQSYDFIYSRMFLNQLNDPRAILRRMYKKVIPGGFVMVEELDFSNYQCFPNSYAFDRFVELHALAKKQQNAGSNIGKNLKDWFQKAGFKNIEVQIVPPSFINGESKHIPSLTLESIATALLQENLTTPTELHALLSELRGFEKQENTLISLPGIYQVIGYKF